jgi:calcineurin-like phosphoesterase family protein
VIYFTADTHFFHSKIIRYCARPFSTAELMKETMIYNWNCRVGPCDTAYVIGDFAFASGSTAAVESLLDRLNGHKHLIVGGHDKRGVTKAEGWESVSDLKEIKTEVGHIFMCHYPTMSWPKQHYGSWHLHGHCHGRLLSHSALKGVNWGLLKMLDVGADCWQFKPVSLYEVKDTIERVTKDAYRSDRLDVLDDLR